MFTIVEKRSASSSSNVHKSLLGIATGSVSSNITQEQKLTRIFVTCVFIFHVSNEIIGSWKLFVFLNKDPLSFLPSPKAVMLPVTSKNMETKK